MLSVVASLEEDRERKKRDRQRKERGMEIWATEWVKK
jgi:hypothetical protein